MSNPTLRAWSDATEGGPGRLAGIGVCIADEHGELVSVRKPMAPGTDSFRLEYLGVAYALEIAWEMGAARVLVHCDSAHVTTHIASQNATKHADLHRRVPALVGAFDECRIVAIPRERNLRAHGLAASATYRVTDSVRWRGMGERDGAGE